MAFRFPGGANDEDSMWRMLNEGKHGISRIPEDRWPVEELQHPKRSEPGRSVTFAAGVLSQIDQFDAVFFGPAKLPGLIRSSGYCWKCPMRPWRMPG